MLPIFHSQTGKQETSLETMGTLHTHWSQTEREDHQQVLCVDRTNFLTLGTLVQENFPQILEAVDNFSLLPFETIFHRYLDYLHKSRKVLKKEILHTDTSLLQLLYQIQAEQPEMDEALYLLSGFSRQHFCPPSFSLILLENSKEALETYTRGKKLLFYTGQDNPHINCDISRIRDSTGKSIEAVFLPQQLAVLAKTEERGQLNLFDKLYCFGELPEHLPPLPNLEQIHFFLKGDDLLQAGFKALRDGISKVSYFLHEDEPEWKWEQIRAFLEDCGIAHSLSKKGCPRVFDPGFLHWFLDSPTTLPPQIELFLHFLFADTLDLLSRSKTTPNPSRNYLGDFEAANHQKILRNSTINPPVVSSLVSNGFTLLISQYNFFRLGTILGKIIDRTIPDFSPTQKGDLPWLFMEYLTQIKHLCPGISMEFQDSSLLEILRIIDRGQERFADETHSKENNRAYFLRLLGILCDHAFVGPHTVHIDVTSLCNTKCTFCGYHTELISEKPWAENGWDRLSLDWEVFTKMIDDLGEIHTSEDILLTGGGEPLVHPKILEMVDYIKAKDMHIILFTNGMLLKQATVDHLIQSGLDTLYWSIHAASSATWIIQHPGSTEKTFPMVIDQMRYLLQKKRELGLQDPQVVYVNCLSAVNVHEVLDIVDLACDLGVNELRFQLMHFGNEETNHMMLTAHQIRFLHSKIPEILERLEKAGIPLIDNFEFQVKQLLDLEDRDSQAKSCDWAYNLFNNSGCFVGYFFSRTWVDGRMSFCCHDRVAGDLKKGGFKENWFSDDYQNFRYVTKHFDDEQNIHLYDGHKGGWLLADDCSWCGNYEYMVRCQKTLERTGLSHYLDVGLNRVFQDKEKEHKDLGRQSIVIGENSFKPKECLDFGGV
jgi:MoaA/NifB/PqqE/SkfB family radical SAM enzyme